MSLGREPRYKCLDCPGSFDLCSMCESNDAVRAGHANDTHAFLKLRDSNRVVASNYGRVDGAAAAGLVAFATCDACKAPIRAGTRLKCATCADFDLCATCGADARIVSAHMHAFMALQAGPIAFPAQ